MVIPRFKYILLNFFISVIGGLFQPVEQLQHSLVFRVLKSTYVFLSDLVDRTATNVWLLLSHWSSRTGLYLYMTKLVAYFQTVETRSGYALTPGSVMGAAAIRRYGTPAQPLMI